MAKQPIKNKSDKPIKTLIPAKQHFKPKKRTHKQEYGTSKLEDKFARDFLDKLGVKYVRQFKAESIERYYDFRIIPDGPIIEINGGYWHGDPRLYESNELNKTQKRNQKVDEYKRKWAALHCIPIYYFWEKDINETPEKVMEQLKKILYVKPKTRKDFYT